ncbi:MAG: hypothetical protein OHK0040_03870 [bacterium]
MEDYEKGLEAFSKGDYEEAQKCFERLIASGRNFADVLNKLGFILSMKGEYEKASIYLKKALEINPRYTEAAINLAFVLSELGRYEESLELREKIKGNVYDAKDRNVDPYVLGKIANMHAEIAERYVELQWYEEAIAEYKKAIHLRPSFVDIRTKLAILEREQGRIDEAIEHLTQCLLENPNYLPAYLQLGLSYYSMGEYELARKQWERVLQKDPENAVAKTYMNMLQKK